MWDATRGGEGSSETRDAAPGCAGPPSGPAHERGLREYQYAGCTVSSVSSVFILPFYEQACAT